MFRASCNSCYTHPLNHTSSLTETTVQFFALLGATQVKHKFNKGSVVERSFDQTPPRLAFPRTQTRVSPKTRVKPVLNARWTHSTITCGAESDLKPGWLWGTQRFLQRESLFSISSPFRHLLWRFGCYERYTGKDCKAARTTLLNSSLKSLQSCFSRGNGAANDSSVVEEWAATLLSLLRSSASSLLRSSSISPPGTVHYVHQACIFQLPMQSCWWGTGLSLVTAALRFPFQLVSRQP